MGLHILPDLEQGSEEWFEQRRGMVTASVVGHLLSVAAPGATSYECPECAAPDGEPCISLRGGTPIKTTHSGRVAVAAANAATAEPVIEVADNKTSRGLTALLVAERITGVTDETPMTPDMWRGVEHEPFAREVYSEHVATVTEIGFMVRDEADWQLGYSPDGLVGDDGAIEIKSPRAKTHLETILADKVPSEYMPQCQAGLLVSGRKWLDFVSFVGGMPLYVKRVYPDRAWHEAIVAAVSHFEYNAARITAEYERRVADMPKTERPDFEIKVA